ncbi:MAG: primosomal protein N' [Calditrichaceae bacterium]
MPFAEVVFNLPLNHSFTYGIPDELDRLTPGMRVLAPFGKRNITGVVTAVTTKSAYSSVKDIIDILDDKPLISERMLDLLKWISDYYISSLGQTVQMALPKGIDTEDKEYIDIADVNFEEKLSERQRDLYLLIGSNPGQSKDYYRKKNGQGSFYHNLRILEKKGLIKRAIERKHQRVGILTRKFVTIPDDYEKIKTNFDDFLKYTRRRPEVDDYMLNNSGKNILMSDFLKKTGMATGTLQKMKNLGICEVVEMQVERTPEFEYREGIKDIVLTDEQENAVRQAALQMETGQFATFLLHGITGSGKTQVYIEVLKKVIAAGQTAIILIPEISLTPQTVSRFKNVFSDQIAVFHSKMSVGERFDAWMACYEDRVKIVVGPRSALFTPLKNIGLIVVDEEHETSYKQSDITPRYHARDVAIYWARMNQAIIMLGSATPSMESYFNVSKNKFKLLQIRNRVENIQLPEVHIVDMRHKRGAQDRETNLFSRVLLDKIEEKLQKKEQILILQNKRGYSSFLQCTECGFIAACPNCEVSLTYHSYTESLQCHLCGYHHASYTDCPSCGGEQIKYKGIGTQRIQQELQKLYPEVRILRMDQDTTRGKNMHDTILKSFADGDADILLGTQMIAKGLDFANVTLVGVISADVGLSLPDFRASERIFHLLTQVSGRSGRGKKPGEVVIQTYVYSHYAIQHARSHDYLGFYMEELEHRKNFKYPPYYKIIQILVSAEKMNEAIDTARKIAVRLRRDARGNCEVIGPAPSVIPKVNKLYRWQVNIKLNPQTDPSGNRTKKILQKLMTPFYNNRQSGIQVVVDVDPTLLG